MGSFTEVFMSFDFRDGTSPEVLAAFSGLAQPLPENAWWGPAPELPEPVTEPQEGWSPDWREAGSWDEFESEPWRHDWATWLSGSMSVSTVPSAALVWSELRRWNLTYRCSFKCWAQAVFTFLEWLGPFIEADQPDRPRFVGYLLDDGEPRPYLLWASDGSLQMEDLNRPT
jgi:hypothetical protein